MIYKLIICYVKIYWVRHFFLQCSINLLQNFSYFYFNIVQFLQSPVDFVMNCRLNMKFYSYNLLKLSKFQLMDSNVNTSIFYFSFILGFINLPFYITIILCYFIFYIFVIYFIYFSFPLKNFSSYFSSNSVST